MVGTTSLTERSVASVRSGTAPRAWATCAILLLVTAGTIGGVFGGPGLGDHEAIVAQCARNMRITGDWICPTIFDTPFFRKPPLPYWLIAAVSYVLPDDPTTGLPVTPLAARLPSAAAALVTVLLMWRLAASMFNPRVGRVTTVLAGSSLVFLLYAANATAEMLLTMCCTWAYLHFWYAATARRSLPRFAHAMGFYVALGVGMLAKGPAPIALVAMPLSAWWYTERPLRVLAREGLGGWRRALACFARGLWPRTRQAFTRLWLFPGLIVFAAVFMPWVLAVAERYPHAWDQWNWQYWQRAQGNYEDTRVREIWYYLPIAAGLTIPWIFLLAEALAAPWLKRYARWHRGLLYAGLWAVLGVAVMSKMEFKKPYYILPAIPGLLLLLGVIADRIYRWTPGTGPASWTVGIGTWRRRLWIRNPRRLGWVLWTILAVAATGLVITGAAWSHKEMPTAWLRITLIAGGTAAALLLAGAAYLRGRGWLSLGMTAAATIVAFDVGWYSCAGAIDATSETGKVAALARALDAAGVPAKAQLFWADRRPDARLDFHFNRPSTYLIAPDEIVAQMVDRTGKDSELQALVLKEAAQRVRGKEPVYLILQQRHYDLIGQSMLKGVRLLAVVKDDDKRGKDWVVVTNVADKPAL